MDTKVRKKLDELDPRKILSLNLRLLKIGGIWWRDICLRGNPLKVFFYRCYESFVILLYLSFNITVYLHAILAEENVAEFSESLLVCVCQVLHGAKLIPVVLRRKNMTSLTVTLENNFYIHKKNLNHEEKSIIKNAMSLAKTTTILYFGSLCVATATMILKPPTIALTSRQVNSTMKQGYNLLVWKAWLPVDPTAYPYNIFAYIYQVALTFIEGCFIIGGLNAFYLVLIIYTTSQFELLCSSLRNATQNIREQIKENYTSNKSCSGPDTGMLMVTRTVQETLIQHRYLDRSSGNKLLHFTEYGQHEASSYMKECVQYHQNLLEYAEKLNEMLSPLFFMELLTASLITCMLGFQLILMPLNIKFFQMLTHLFTAVFELGLFCWFGSSLITQSEEVHKAAYECGWYDMLPEAKRYVQMVIMRGQRPVALRTGRFGLLSMPLFAELMKASYTYLAMLKQLQEE